jgi:hypothetical protein
MKLQLKMLEWDTARDLRTSVVGTGLRILLSRWETRRGRAGGLEAEFMALLPCCGEPRFGAATTTSEDWPIHDLGAAPTTGECVLPQGLITAAGAELVSKFDRALPVHGPLFLPRTCGHRSRNRALAWLLQ